MSEPRDPLAEALREWWAPLIEVGGADRFRAILARHGLAVVPVEATKAMRTHMHDKALILCDPEHQEASILNDVAIWRAMIAAAQEPSRDA